MGAAATKEDDKGSRARTIRTKVKALTAFSSQPSDKAKEQEETVSAAGAASGSRRDELLNFIKERREEKVSAWDRLHREDNGEPGDASDNEGDDVDETECGMCGGSDFRELLPCRICGRKYHRKCLTESGLFTDHEITFFDRAGTPIGWSCLKCDNIFNLLTSTELDDLSNDFEKLDINKDASISIEEYLDHRKRAFAKDNGREMMEDEENFERNQFKYLDADGGGAIEYSEYLKHFACLMLAARPKAELVALLTPRERRYARCVFDSIDSDRRGSIGIAEAQLRYRSWYTGLFTDMLSQGKVAQTTVTDLSDARARDLVDVAGSCCMDYDGFLESRAIYLISSRPNNVAAMTETCDKCIRN